MKSLRENFQLALSTLAAHRLRSALAMLGIVIGTAVVISIGAVLTGLDRSIASLLERFGTRTVLVSRRSPGLELERSGQSERLRKVLTFEDAEAIGRLCPAIERVAAIVYDENDGRGGQFLTVRHQTEEAYVPVQHFSGVTSEYIRVANIVVRAGRFFTESEGQRRLPVAVIGHEIGQALFPNESALGKTIEVNGQALRVLGVIDRRKGNFFGTESADQFVVVPYQTFRKLFPNVRDHFLMAQALPGRLDEAVDQIRWLLRSRRLDPRDQPDSFYVATAESVIEQFQAITGAVTSVMLLLSSIGLLIGGVGVMNIMLVSVTERTREIGIRKAVGARRRDIVQQFLLEAIALTGLGGLAGVVTGASVGLFLRWLYPTIPTAIPVWAIAAGLLVSLVVGLFFGLWPAIRAARLAPVEALRYE
jgi:putative ABC transport system permease protein